MRSNKTSHFKKSPNDVSNNHETWIYGKHPVFMALRNPKRKIYQLIVTSNNKEELEKFLSEKQIKINKNLIGIKDNNMLNVILPAGAIHQGFALKTSPINFLNENDFLQKIEASNEKLGYGIVSKLPPILILDQLTDPHNIGAIVRSAVAFGVKNIGVTKHNFPKESAIISKSSSGMIELANLIMISNLNNFINNLKKNGYWCVGLDGASEKSIKEIKDYDSLALIIGSEGEGIRNLVKQNCDILVKITMDPLVESLNASNAAAVSLYELFGKKYEI